MPKISYSEPLTPQAEKNVRYRAYENWQKRRDDSKTLPEDDWRAAILELKAESTFPGRMLRRLWQWSELGNKKPWDILQLLIIPLALGGATWLLQDYSERRAELTASENQKRAEMLAQDSANQETLTNYLNQMESLSKEVKEGSLLSDLRLRPIAQVKTITALQSLGTDTLRQQLILQFLQSADLSGSYLFASDGYEEGLLSQANLRRANFAESDLSGANLNKAILREANLYGADFTFTTFKGADLRNAKLGTATLHDAKFDGANLSRADLSDANLENAHFWDTDLSDANLENANFRRAKFYYANLKRADLSNADLSNAGLQNSDLSDATLRGAVFKEATYTMETQFPVGFNPKNHGMYLIAPQSNLSNADLSGSDISSADLSHANLSRANLSHTNLSRSDLINANLRGADFSGADLRDTNLSGADLNGAVFERALYTPETQFSDDFDPDDHDEMILIGPQVDLTGFDLSGIELVHADLKNADLRAADLSYVDLHGADLSGANLGASSRTSGAYLRYSNLSDANLSDANLSYANLSDVNITGAILLRADLTGSKFSLQQQTATRSLLLCKTKLPQGMEEISNRDCAKLPQIFLQRYPDIFKTLEDAQKFVNKLNETEEE
jgi:uncharacterized protein YjbI with pentapeptide repeats